MLISLLPPGCASPSVPVERSEIPDSPARATRPRTDRSDTDLPGATITQICDKCNCAARFTYGKQDPDDSGQRIGKGLRPRGSVRDQRLAGLAYLAAICPVYRNTSISTRLFACLVSGMTMTDDATCRCFARPWPFPAIPVRERLLPGPQKIGHDGVISSKWFLKTTSAVLSTVTVSGELVLVPLF